LDSSALLPSQSFRPLVAPSRQIHDCIRSGSHGGQNKLLTTAQEAAVLGYVREQANAGFRHAEKMITRAVTHVRALQIQPGWIMSFMKAHPELKKLEIKPMGKTGKSAQDMADALVQWFKDFNALLDQQCIQAVNM
jgi:hypothetical protein